MTSMATTTPVAAAQVSRVACVMRMGNGSPSWDPGLSVGLAIMMISYISFIMGKDGSMFSLETSRLVLRDLQLVDVTSFYELGSDPEVTRCQYTIQIDSEPAALEWL